ncbi:helix-turn-helix domain-containing protein [Pseudonocardia sp.]|uniref:TetR/AcrR family transcriptional regulator n=1 Tax=Pseudonocardia sp. TaxID=60912 RepID=UPI00262D318C|nr:helix-turn-helix domain-containing protein [Pseudonocardia sp.]
MNGARRAAGRNRSADTRRRIVEAATRLFVERGYLETTMSGLAGAAGVAVQTLYLSFDGKAAVLEAALAAQAENHPSGWVPDADGPTLLAAHVSATAAAVARQHPLAAVLRAAAADPEPAALLARSRRDALAAHARAVDELAERPGFTVLVSLQRATEMAAALLSPETYGLLVADQGWTVPDWVDWATRHLAVDLYPGSSGQTERVGPTEEVCGG